MTRQSDYLIARYAEEAAAARAATPGPWRWEGDVGKDEASLVALSDEVVLGAHGMHTEGFLAVDESDAAHIALHDPPRVLAHIAAKRRLVEMCATWIEQEGRYLNGGDAVSIAGRTQARNAETVIRALIQPYATRPDFDPAWWVA